MNFDAPHKAIICLKNVRKFLFWGSIILVKFDVATDMGFRTHLPTNFECIDLFQIKRNGVSNADLLGVNPKCKFISDDSVEILLGNYIRNNF